MVKSLRVWAHWTDAPPRPGLIALPPAPFPPPFAGYKMPGGTPPRDQGNPNWSALHPGPVGTVNQVVVWCELANQDDITQAQWFGPTWPGLTPPGPTPAGSCPPGFPGQA